MRYRRYITNRYKRYIYPAIIKFEASAKYNKKLSNDLELNVAASLSVEFSDKGEYCGTDFTHFYESKTKLLVFQNYGARLRLGSQ